MTYLRTHMCGALRAADENKEVSVLGWVHRRRDLTGRVQIVIDPFIL